ncbi:ABC transporter, substrate-binding protein, aliphatic sulfonates family [compost metagenome]
MKKVLAYLVFVVAAFCSCNNVNKKEEDVKTMKTSLVQEWFPYSGYAGEVMAIYETAKKNNIQIDLRAGADNIDPLKLVISGESDFGVASADRILQANEKGADLIVIGVINYKSPTCFLSKKEKNIRVPKDFENKTIGILTGTNTELIYKIFKNKASLNDKKIREVEIPFDLGTFISGAYDVRPAFIYDETVSLDLQNIAYDVLKPEDFGVDFIGTVYFTTRKNIEQHPEMVKRFISSIKEGWGLALKEPEKAIGYLKKYDENIDLNRELRSLKKGLPYFEGENGQILYASEKRWGNMTADLIKLGFIKKFDFDKTVDYKFIMQK